MPSSPDAPGSAASRTLWTPRQLRALTALALAGAIVVRAILLLRGGTTAESLTSVGAIAAGVSPLAASPLERGLTAAAVAVGPMEYWPLAAGLLVLWTAYCGAAWLACRSLSRKPGARLTLLLLVVFSPMTVPGLSIWPIGVQGTALAIGVLLVIHGASSLLRRGQLRSSWTISAGTLVALAGSPAGPWSPALLVPLWAIVLVLLPGPSGLRGRDLGGEGMVGEGMVERSIPTGTALASLALPVLLTAAWTGATAESPVSALPRDLGPMAGFVGAAVGSGAVPSLVGGPAAWETSPTWPAAAAPGIVAFLGLQVVLAALFACAVLARRGLAPWGIGVGFAVLSVAFFALSTDPVLAGSGAQMLSLFAVPAFLLVACAASLATTPLATSLATKSHPEEVRWFGGSTPAVVTFVAIDVFLALSVMSALAWSDARGIYAGTEYIREAKAALAVADRNAPLLPQVLPPQVADPRLAPLNRTDIVFAPLPDRPDFATWTTDLRAFDGKGTLQPASLEGIDVSVACTSWAPGITLAQELPEFTYVVSIQLPAPSPAGFVVQLGQGPPATVPAGVGAATVYTQVSGSGSVLSLASLGNQPLCPTALRIGQVQPLLPEDEVRAP